MLRRDIWPAIELEVRYSKKKHPRWPDHPAAQAAIVSAAAGALIKSSLDIKYSKGKKDPSQIPRDIELLKKHALQAAAAAIRFLENLDK